MSDHINRITFPIFAVFSMASLPYTSIAQNLTYFPPKHIIEVTAIKNCETKTWLEENKTTQKIIKKETEKGLCSKKTISISASSNVVPDMKVEKSLGIDFIAGVDSSLQISVGKNGILRSASTTSAGRVDEAIVGSVKLLGQVVGTAVGAATGLSGIGSAVAGLGVDNIAGLAALKELNDKTYNAALIGIDDDECLKKQIDILQEQIYLPSSIEERFFLQEKEAFAGVYSKNLSALKTKKNASEAALNCIRELIGKKSTGDVDILSGQLNAPEESEEETGIEGSVGNGFVVDPNFSALFARYESVGKIVSELDADFRAARLAFTTAAELFATQQGVGSRVAKSAERTWMFELDELPIMEFDYNVITAKFAGLNDRHTTPGGVEIECGGTTTDDGSVQLKFKEFGENDRGTCYKFKEFHRFTCSRIAIRSTGDAPINVSTVPPKDEFSVWYRTAIPVHVEVYSPDKMSKSFDACDDATEKAENFIRNSGSIKDGTSGGNDSSSSGNNKGVQYLFHPSFGLNYISIDKSRFSDRNLTLSFDEAGYLTGFSKSKTGDAASELPGQIAASIKDAVSGAADTIGKIGDAQGYVQSIRLARIKSETELLTAEKDRLAAEIALGTSQSSREANERIQRINNQISLLSAEASLLDTPINLQSEAIRAEIELLKKKAELSGFGTLSEAERKSQISLLLDTLAGSDDNEREEFMRQIVQENEEKNKVLVENLIRLIYNLSEGN